MKILIANRACAAMRIIRCCQHLGLDYVTIHSLDDNSSLHVTSSANSVLLHPTSSTSLDTYLNVERILEICLDQACTAIHPGYGFLSENADFAQACADRGVVFIGPTPEQISSFGLKHTARALAVQFAVPVVPGTGLLYSLEEAETLALEIGYPVLLKCVAGGGGIGLHVCPTVEELRLGWDSVKRLAVRAFNNDGVFMEKYLAHSRHVEVQVFGDSLGHVVCLGDRDCTSQRRNQKVIEEAPAPDLPPLVREQMWQSALRLAKGVGYRSAGTVEYIVDNSTLDFYFLEVNTRVQVEHGVTEQITGVDLISWMIQTARGELDLSTYVLPPLEWHSIQCRIYAEDANKAFQPSSGLLSLVEFPNPTQECRVERWIQNGTVVSTQYDPMLGKLICRGRTRTEAIANLVQALRGTVIYGLESNLEFLSQLLMDARFTEFQSMSTHWLDEFTYRPSTIDVLEPGAQTTVQDFPGRVGYWFAGVPPSGPMDSLAFRLGNALVGNTPATRAAGLEICQGRVQLRFNVPCVIALTGCEFAAELDGVPIKFWESHSVASSQVLSLTNVHSNPGLRAYLCISNRGLAMADYLGSKSTFALGKLGGITLKHGDVLRVATTGGKDAALPKQQRIAFPPTYTSNWDLRVTVGPHSDFFTSAYFEHQFLQQTFEVHYNSNRLGIRLNAPSKPEFTRLDGGEAGLHPSNIHDVVYAVGSVNFTGDLPVILGPDGPSLGGFVCPVTICQADLWKTGQVKPGDKLRFCVTDFDHAREQELAMDLWISSGKCFAEALTVVDLPSTLAASILRQITVHDLLVVYRLAGDRNVLIEYGELKLDLRYRCRVYALEQHLQQFPISGVLEVSPGVRSVQIKFDSRLIESLEWLLDQLVLMEQSLPAAEEMEIPSRVVRLPLAFDASSTKLAISKYRQSVRDKAPWLPSNIDFIQRINGLTSSQQVSDVVFAANYLVLGLGDVYLGAPCAVPLDPRHRLQTTKYNPARTWTEEGEVGIGGVFMCIYGMQSPGGYQLVGRTVPVWNNHPQQRHHWLLQSFDQVQFYPVSESELLEIRSGIQAGRVKLDIQSTVFNVKDYLGFLECHEQDIAQFQRHQNEAFQLERALWAAQGVNEEEEQVEVKQECDLSNTVPVCAQISGSVWSVHVSEGDFVHKGDLLLVVEAMKLEVSVYALETGVINRVFVRPGTKLAPGDLLVGWEPKPTLPTGRLDFAVLRELYTKYSVTAVVLSLIQRLEEHADKPVFISRFTNDALVSRARALDQIKFEPLPLLFGVPFAVKDNIDVLGLPTTCACPAYSFLPECNAT
ncbi:urea carboxylase, partial [Batrachochytrium salamandrivorans]